MASARIAGRGGESMRRGIAASVAIAALTIGGCGFGPDKSREDAHDTANVDKTSPNVIAFNNHYPNVETKCDGFGHRLFVTTHDSAVGRNVIVMPDPTCPGWTKNTNNNVAP